MLQSMVKIYYRLITKQDSNFTIDDVPENYKEAVLELLAADNV